MLDPLIWHVCSFYIKAVWVSCVCISESLFCCAVSYCYGLKFLLGVKIAVG